MNVLLVGLGRWGEKHLRVLSDLGVTEPLRRELEEFLESAAGRRRPSVTVEDGLRALQVVEAAQLSSRLGRRVTLAEVDA